MKLFIFVFILFFLNHYAQTASLKEASFQGGKIYELNSEKRHLLFTMNAELTKLANGISVFKSSYVDPKNNEVLTEEATFELLNLQNYTIDQKQLNESYQLKIADGKMHFSVTKDGKTNQKIRALPKNLIIGPSFVPFLELHWHEVQAKKKVQAELAMLDYMDTFSFEFEKIRDSKVEGTDVVIVRMNPHNSLLASIVRPIYFVVNVQGTQILELKGRMLPKKKIGTRWKDFEAEAIFTYNEPIRQKN